MDLPLSKLYREKIPISRDCNLINIWSESCLSDLLVFNHVLVLLNYKMAMKKILINETYMVLNDSY